MAAYKYELTNAPAADALTQCIVQIFTMCMNRYQLKVWETPNDVKELSVVVKRHALPHIIEFKHLQL